MQRVATNVNCVFATSSPGNVHVLSFYSMFMSFGLSRDAHIASMRITLGLFFLFVCLLVCFLLSLDRRRTNIFRLLRF